MLTLMIGPVSLQWQLDEVDPRAGEFLAAYESYCGTATGQMVIEAHIASPKTNNGPPGLPNSFIRYRRIQGRDFVLGDDLITGHLSAMDHIECTIHPVLLHGTGLRVLEQFMYLLFYHAVQITTGHRPGGPFLLHSSGVLHEGAVHIFCGPAGSGKSTAAALCPVRPMLSDEALAITQNQAGSDGSGSSARSIDPSGTITCQVSGTPINPFCTEKSPGSGPLAGLYLIEHGDNHTVSPITREEAVPRLTAEVILPLGLFETDLTVGMGRSLDHALFLYRTGLVQRLAFRPDPGFWDLLVMTPTR